MYGFCVHGSGYSQLCPQCVLLILIYRHFKSPTHWKFTVCLSSPKGTCTLPWGFCFCAFLFLNIKTQLQMEEMFWENMSHHMLRSFPPGCPLVSAGPIASHSALAKRKKWVLAISLGAKSCRGGFFNSLGVSLEHFGHSHGEINWMSSILLSPTQRW